MRRRATSTPGARAAITASLALILAPRAAAAQGECRGEPTSARLHVIIEGVRDARGEMAATLYGPDPAKFLKAGGELKVWRDPAQPPGMDMCVWLPGPGDYAVAIYHDANGNHHFDHGTFGPTEGYGFSRNPHLFFGPPNVGQVRFTAGEGETTVRIRLRYP